MEFRIFCMLCLVAFAFIPLCKANYDAQMAKSDEQKPFRPMKMKEMDMGIEDPHMVRNMLDPKRAELFVNNTNSSVADDDEKLPPPEDDSILQTGPNIFKDLTFLNLNRPSNSKERLQYQPSHLSSYEESKPQPPSKYIKVKRPPNTNKRPLYQPSHLSSYEESKPQPPSKYIKVKRPPNSNQRPQYQPSHLSSYKDSSPQNTPKCFKLKCKPSEKYSIKQFSNPTASYDDYTPRYLPPGTIKWRKKKWSRSTASYEDTQFTPVPKIPHPPPNWNSDGERTTLIEKFSLPTIWSTVRYPINQAKKIEFGKKRSLFGTFRPTVKRYTKWLSKNIDVDKVALDDANEPNPVPEEVDTPSKFAENITYPTPTDVDPSPKTTEKVLDPAPTEVDPPPQNAEEVTEHEPPKTPIVTRCTTSKPLPKLNPMFLLTSNELEENRIVSLLGSEEAGYKNRNKYRAPNLATPPHNYIDDEK